MVAVTAALKSNFLDDTILDIYKNLAGADALWLIFVFHTIKTPFKARFVYGKIDLCFVCTGTVARPRIMSILTHSEKNFSEISKKREEIWMKTKFF